MENIVVDFQTQFAGIQERLLEMICKKLGVNCKDANALKNRDIEIIVSREVGPTFNESIIVKQYGEELMRFRGEILFEKNILKYRIVSA